MDHLLQSSQASGRYLMRVGDLARATGKTVRAIHLYEQLGLLRPATRSSGGFRLYDSSAVERIRWIDSLHGLGFSLHEMRDVLRRWWTSEQGPVAMAGLRELFTRKLDETREAIRRHQDLEHELEDGLRYLETCQSCAAPGSVEVCVSCPQDHGVVAVPGLVEGIHTAPGSARRTFRPEIVRVEDMLSTRTPRGAERSSAPGSKRKEQDR